MKKFSTLSLKAKIIGIVVLINLVLGAGSLYSMNLLETDYENQILLSFKSSAVNLGHKIAAQFFERYGDIQAFAVNETVKSLNEDRMTVSLNEYARLYAIYDLILVVDSKGQFIASNSESTDGKKIDKDKLRSYDFTTMPWFQAAIKGQFTEDSQSGYAGTFFEEIQPDPVLRLVLGEARLSTGFTSTIKDAQGEVIGIITNRANVKWIGGEITSTLQQAMAEEYPNTHVSLVDKAGNILLEAGLNQYQNSAQNIDVSSNYFKENLKATHQPAGERVLEGNTDAIRSFHSAEKAYDIVGFHFIDNPKWIKAIGWSVLVHDDEKEVLASAHAAATIFYWIYGVCTTFALALSIWFGIVIARSLSSVSENLKTHSNNLLEASALAATSSTQLAESSNQQAAALQQTVAAIDEINAMVEKNVDSANQSKEVSLQSRDAAMRGRQTVEQMLQAIHEILQTNEEVVRYMNTNSSQMQDITKLISDIGNKTKIINEIVFQTKLLSFNASVEAARAGEAGKGFAVVAEEVGNLAQMSGVAANDISSMLEDSIQKVTAIVRESKANMDNLMDSAKAKVQAGSETAKSCNEALEQILNQVSSVDTLVSEIAVASQEQATGIREIAKAIGQMEQATHQNSSVAESTSLSAESLDRQSTELHEAVSSLVQIVQGSSTEQSEHQNLKKEQFEGHHSRSPHQMPASTKKSKRAPTKNRSSSHSSNVLPFRANYEANNEAQKQKSKASAMGTLERHQNHSSLRQSSGADFAPSANHPGFEEN